MKIHKLHNVSIKSNLGANFGRSSWALRFAFIFFLSFGVARSLRADDKTAAESKGHETSSGKNKPGPDKGKLDKLKQLQEARRKQREAALKQIHEAKGAQKESWHDEVKSALGGEQLKDLHYKIDKEDRPERGKPR